MSTDENLPIQSAESGSNSLGAASETLSALFQADPLSLTGDQIEIICAEFRKQRAAWENEKRRANAAGKRPSARRASSKATIEKVATGDAADALADLFGKKVNP